MSGKNSQLWIEAGYQMVADNGFKSLSVEVLARAVGKNKSSFYHYFGSIEIFISALLKHHKEQSKIFAEETRLAQDLFPGVIDSFVNHKTDMFFHKQLRINRTNKEFTACFEEVFDMIESASHDKYASFFNLSGQSFLATAFLKLIFENFLLRVTPETYTYEWIKGFLQENLAMLLKLGDSQNTKI